MITESLEFVRRKSVFLAILAIIVFLIYSISLDAPFHYDDERVIYKDKSIRSLDIQDIFKANPFRFLLTLSFALNYHFSALSTSGYRIVNILIHIANVIFLYLLILKLQPHLLKEYEIKEPASPAFLCSIFFALSPVMVESVTYISSRSEILCAFFIFPSFYFLICFLEKEKNLYLAASVFFYIAATLTKERGAMLFFLLPVAVFCINGTKKLKQSFLSLAPFLVMACVYMFYRKYARGDSLSTGFVTDSYLHFLLQAEASLKNFRTVLLPVNLSIFYWFFNPQSFFEFSASGHLLLFVFSIFFSILIAPKKIWVIFFWCWYFIFLSPNIIFPFQDIMADRWLYLPSAGIYSIFSFFVYWLFRKEQFSKTAVIIAVIISFCFVGMTIDRNRVWKSGVTLWEDTVKKAFLSPRTHNNYGVALATSGKIKESIREFQISLEINKWYSPAWSNLAKAYRTEGNEEEMLKATSALVDCGEYYVKQGAYKEAVMSYNSVLEYVPDSIAAMGNLATIYIIIGNNDLGRKYLMKLLEIAPDNKAAREMLSRIGEGNGTD
ncbi:MAG: hypothetical protein HZA77_13505 [Candidatus Schekmanbacteria bacterium]|nr:hypothetical protein [Candidatus Schekmanbacteria bacterium]